MQSKIVKAALGPIPVHAVIRRAVPRVEVPVPEDDYLKVIAQIEINPIKERLDETPGVSANSVQKKPGDRPRASAFRPLTEDEKHEFENSLDAKGKQILAELMGIEIFVRTSAA